MNYHTITQTINEAQREKEVLLTENSRLNRELVDKNKEKDDMLKEKKVSFLFKYYIYSHILYIHILKYYIYIKW